MRCQTLQSARAHLICNPCKAHPVRAAKNQAQSLGAVCNALQSYAKPLRGPTTSIQALPESSTLLSEKELKAESQLYPGALPPATRKATDLITVKEGLWALRQDFLFNEGVGIGSINLNMFVTQLSTGDLLAYGPIAPTPEVLAHLASLPGPLTHILIPNLSPEHFYYAWALAEQFPQATIWTCPGLLEGKGFTALPGLKEPIQQLAESKRCREVGRQFTAELGGEVDIALFQDSLGLYSEVALLAVKQKAVMLADLGFGAFQDEGMPAAPFRWTGQAVGVYKQLGCPVAFPLFKANAAAAAAWVREVLEWDFDTVGGCHLTPAIANGKQEFERCYAFALEQSGAAAAEGQR